jgi:hypothetical protein
MRAVGSNTQKAKGPAGIFRSKRLWFCVILLALFVLHFYPGWIHVAHVLQRNKRSTLPLSADLRIQIVSGDPAAVSWLEEQIEAGTGSIPALLLLQSMTGETFGQVPNLCRGYSFCGRTGKWSRWHLMNAGFRTMRKRERQAYAKYTQRKSALRFDHLHNVDLYNEDSVRASFKQGWDELDGGRIYLLLSEESQGPGFFRGVMRYFEWLKERKGLTYRMTTIPLAPGPQDYVEICSLTDAPDTPKGHGVYFEVFRNPQTQQYTIGL